MDAGDGVKRIGRADQPQQLAGRAGSLRALLLSRRSFSTFSCRYGWAKPQPQRHDEWTRTSKYAWRARLSMHISNGWSRQPEARPVALQNPRRSGVRKTGAPSRFSYIGCVPPNRTWAAAVFCVMFASCIDPLCTQAVAVATILAPTQKLRRLRPGREWRASHWRG